MTISERDGKLFGGNVVRLRKERGLSGSALARKADIGRDTLLRIETGIRAVRLDTLLKLADALEVDPGELLNGLRQ